MNTKQTKSLHVINVRIRADKKAALPSGFYKATVDLGSPSIVRSAYVRVGPKDRPVTSRSFDDGQVVVDFDSRTGELAGLELLEVRGGSARYPEIGTFIDESSEGVRNLLGPMLWTTLAFSMRLAAAVRACRSFVPEQVTQAEEPGPVQRRFHTATEQSIGDSPEWCSAHGGVAAASCH